MKWFKKFALAAAALMGLVVVISIIHHYRLRAAENNFRAELKAKGMVMDLSQALPPTPQPEQDGTQYFLKAAALLKEDKTYLTTNWIYAMRPVAPGKAMATSQQSVVYLDEVTNSWESMSAAIAQNQAALTLLLQIIVHPALDFHIPYELGTGDGFNITNLNLIQLKKSARYLSEAAILDLHEGNTASAVTNERAMLALADAMRNQRFIISELVRMTMVNMAQSLTWEVLQSSNVTDGQLAALQNDWGQVNFLQSYQDALTMERISGDITLAEWRHSNSGMEKYLSLERKAWENLGLSDGSESALMKAREFFDIYQWRYWWSYPDEMRTLQGYELLMKTAQQAVKDGGFLRAYQQQQSELENLGMTNSDTVFGSLFSGQIDMHSIMSESITTLQAAFHKVMLYDTANHVIITAIALKRFQLQHGNYPDKLADLVPEFISSVPLDAVDGQPLRYRRNADGTFLLYSVGENGVDDGGDPSLPAEVSSPSYFWQNLKARDWVWPQAATAAEVQKYYAEQAKELK